MSRHGAGRPEEPTRERRVDFGLTALLALQGFTLFVAIPLGGAWTAARLLLDACHLSFAIICISVLTRHRVMQAALLATLALLVVGPALGRLLPTGFNLTPGEEHEIIALVAFAFNGGVTALVARHVFAPGRVTAHRVRGAILLYLNVAALFAIAYGVLATSIEGAFAGSLLPSNRGGSGTATFSYFSLATITTTGYGDIVPLHPLTRSLANLEAVFGQLFPATLLARLVSLHVAHERDGTDPDTKSHPRP